MHLKSLLIIPIIRGGQLRTNSHLESLHDVAGLARFLDYRYFHPNFALHPSQCRVVASFLVSALSASSAILLILEMYTSWSDSRLSAPLRAALAQPSTQVKVWV